MPEALPQRLSCVDLVVTITNGAGRGKLRRHVSGRGDERGHERLVKEGVSVGRVAHGAVAQPLLRVGLGEDRIEPADRALALV